MCSKIVTIVPTRRLPRGSQNRFLGFLATKEWISRTQIVAHLRAFIPPECAIRNATRHGDMRSYSQPPDILIERGYKKIVCDLAFLLKRNGSVQQKRVREEHWYRITPAGISHLEKLNASTSDMEV